MSTNLRDLTVGELRRILAHVPDSAWVTRRDWFGNPVPYDATDILTFPDHVEITPPQIGPEPD